MKNKIFIYTIVLCQIILSEVKSQGFDCPRECTCEHSPLRSASFVLTWMTSWGEDDLPNIHPNEILTADLVASSTTALDAEVDVDLEGLHATCSLHSTTNITTLLAALPSSTMVLTILQAPGCNFTVVDGGQLVGLSSLKALHLQGYAHIREKQVSGFEPNNVAELIAHRKLMKEELQKEGKEEITDLRLALAEDALQPLSSLQLLDLQFVRLVASEEARRSRRYSKEPVASTTLLDMPLKQFLKLANKVDSFYLPPYLQKLNKENEGERHSLEEFDKEDFSALGRKIENLKESFKLQRNTFLEANNKLHKTDPNKHFIPEMNDNKPPEINEKEEEKEMKENDNIVPYSIYKAEMQPKLAPFKSLKKLKYLRVAHARLDRIGTELLEGLHELHTLTLEYNKIKILPAGLFAPTPNLRHLSLAHNNVLLLDPSGLEGLSKILTIDLDYNELSVLGPASFPSLPSLKTLRVNENPLTHLLPDTFSTLNSTENIFLGSRNTSMDVHVNSFRFLYNVNNMVLNNVSLERLQKSLLIGMPQIQDLSIHGRLPEIDYDAFSTTPNLRTLNLSYCHLSVLSLDAFFGLKQLSELDLSHNELMSLSPGTFDHLISLRKLYLNNNHLTTLPLGIFIPIPAKLIQLNNNPWHCTCDLLQLRPSITNKVERSGHIICHWDEKLSTVCEKARKRLVYDARVAPLCHEPRELFGSDVYHAALRHLKCSKYHWDPRLLAEKRKISEKNRNQELEKLNVIEVDKNDESEEVNWLPLTAFTPEPIDAEDLLQLAEEDGLEEAIDTTTKTQDNNPLSLKNQKDIEHEKKSSDTLKQQHSDEQKDEPKYISTESPEIITKMPLDIYKLRKAKVKSLMKLQYLKKNRFSKNRYSKNKSDLKKIILAKQRANQERKEREKEKEDYAYNFIEKKDLKNNIYFS